MNLGVYTRIRGRLIDLGIPFNHSSVIQKSAACDRYRYDRRADHCETADPAWLLCARSRDAGPRIP